MSHFSVLVITKKHPLDDDHKELAEALVPFHEFECTGRNDEHICELNVTEDTRNDYEGGKRTYLVDPDGNRHDPYAEEFYREPTKEESDGRYSFSSDVGCLWGFTNTTRNKVRFVPDGWAEKDFPHPEVMTFAEYCRWADIDTVPADGEIDSEDKHKFHFAMLNDKGEVLKIIKRTNVDKWKFVSSDGKCVGTSKGKLLPKDVVDKRTEVSEGEYRVTYHLVNQDGAELKRICIGGSQWDWWTIGGRYTNKFVSKDGVHSDSIQCEDLDMDEMLRRNKADNETVWHEAEKEYHRFPSIANGKILSFEEHLFHFYKLYDEITASPPLVDGRPLPFYEYASQVNKEYDEFMEQSKNQGDLVADYTSKDRICTFPFEMIYGIGRKCPTKELLVAGTVALSCFAFVKDGEWHERGDMGWFACVSDKKESDAWQAEVDAMIAALEPDDWITCVDCHI
jgi:hypothetical protein